MISSEGSERAHELDAAVEASLRNDSVSAGTEHEYARMWKLWEGLCAESGVGPYTDDLAPVRRMYAKATRMEPLPIVGEPERARPRDRPYSASYLESVLAAVSHRYAVIGRTAPHRSAAHVTEARELKQGYGRRVAGSAPVLTKPLLRNDIGLLLAAEPPATDRQLMLLTVVRIAIERSMTAAEAAALTASDLMALDGQSYVRDRSTGEWRHVPCSCQGSVDGPLASVRPMCLAHLIARRVDWTRGLESPDPRAPLLALVGYPAPDAALSARFRTISDVGRHFVRPRGGSLRGTWGTDSRAHAGSLLLVDALLLHALPHLAMQAQIGLSWMLRLRLGVEASSLLRTDLTIGPDGTLAVEPSTPLNEWHREGPNSKGRSWLLAPHHSATSPHGRSLRWLLLLDALDTDQQEPVHAFPGMKGKRITGRLSQEGLGKAFKRLCALAGLEGFTPASVYAGAAVTTLERTSSDVVALSELRIRQPRHLAKYAAQARRPAQSGSAS